jgi:hypothetical protein
MDVEIQAATREPIYKTITNKISNFSGDLLFFFWGGHGVMADNEVRRLFYADATPNSKLNSDLNSLLVSLRSSYYLGLKQQVCMIDACANFIKDIELATLPAGDFPHGTPSHQHKQFIFLAAARGELAKNLETEQTGLFSKVLLKHLTDAAWLPDFPDLAKQIMGEFETLRAAGETKQTPIVFQYTDWAGNLTTMSSLPTETIPPKKPSSGISSTIYNQLRIALLDCGSFYADDRLRAIFAHPKLAPWRHSVPQASDQAERVDKIITFLSEKYRGDTKENALVLLTRILSERIDPGDECHQRLADIAVNLEHQLKGV